MTDMEWRRCDPPKLLLEAMISRPEHFGIQRVQKFTRTPTITADGQVTREPGYYSESEILYAPSEKFECDAPEKPTSGQTQRALDTLLEPTRDIPFVGESDVANTIACMLAITGRSVIQGPIPLFMPYSSTPGTGKSLLADIISAAATAEFFPPQAFPNEESEQIKTVVSILRQGKPVALFDNVNDTIDSPVAAIVATAWPYLEGRILGQSQMLRLIADTIFIFTANSPQFSREIFRRFVMIQLEACMEDPSQGRSFRIPNLKQWLRDNSDRLLNALLTLWRAWFSAGSPRWKGRAMGSFEEFCGIVGGVLDVAGVPGFLENRSRASQGLDPETAAWRALVGLWAKAWNTRPVGVAELYDLCHWNDPTGCRTEREEPLLAFVLGAGNEKSQRIRLGKAISKMEGRVFGLWQILRADPDHRGRQQYRLESVKPRISADVIPTSANIGKNIGERENPANTGTQLLSSSRSDVADVIRQSHADKKERDISFPGVVGGGLQSATSANSDETARLCGAMFTRCGADVGGNIGAGADIDPSDFLSATAADPEPDFGSIL